MHEQRLVGEYSIIMPVFLEILSLGEEYGEEGISTGNNACNAGKTNICENRDFPMVGVIKAVILPYAHKNSFNEQQARAKYRYSLSKSVETL